MVNTLKHIIFKCLDKIAPRQLTDWYVLNFINMPIQLGGGKKALFTDFAQLTHECTNFDDEVGVEKYINDYQNLIKQHTTTLTARNQKFLSSLLIALNHVDRINLIDVGGSIGAEHHLLKNLGLLSKIDSYIVVEQQKIVDVFSRIVQDESTLTYVANIDDIVLNSSGNFLYISGTLQYMPKPMELIKSGLEKLSPNFVFINRTPMWSLSQRLVKQLDYKYKNTHHRASYASWIINENELKDMMLKAGYRYISLEVVTDAPYIVGYGLLPYQSLFFIKNNT